MNALWIPLIWVLVHTLAEVKSDGSGKTSDYNGEADYFYSRRTPYIFGYRFRDGRGNLQEREEETKPTGSKFGSYSYVDASGIYRKVQYVADDRGFRATVSTNEPGTTDKDPADVRMLKEETDVGDFVPTLREFVPLAKSAEDAIREVSASGYPEQTFPDISSKQRREYTFPEVAPAGKNTDSFPGIGPNLRNSRKIYGDSGPGTSHGIPTATEDADKFSRITGYRIVSSAEHGGRSRVAPPTYTESYGRRKKSDRSSQMKNNRSGLEKNGFGVYGDFAGSSFPSFHEESPFTDEYSSFIPELGGHAVSFSSHESSSMYSASGMKKEYSSNSGTGQNDGEMSYYESSAKRFSSFRRSNFRDHSRSLDSRVEASTSGRVYRPGTKARSKRQRHYGKRQNTIVKIHVPQGVEDSPLIPLYRDK